MQNTRVLHATGALVVMRSVEQGPNPQVPIGQAIQNFPGTPQDISRLNGTLPFRCSPLFLLSTLN